ncbi:hypothetical protein EV359DRAFT_63665 [Lentinula novae-zelandiae]|nr:hypothetical protein EV359DRAFT_63665 [Lentinula novae-zelandiae]
MSDIDNHPSWLQNEEALTNLAYLRRKPTDDIELLHELAGIEASIEEEREARKGLGWIEAFFQWCGVVKIPPGILHTLSGGPLLIDAGNFRYYAPQIFTSIGYTGYKNSLLASGVYGVVKLVATSIFIFIFFGVETLSRKLPFFMSAMGMGTRFSIVGAIIKTHPPPATSSTSVVAAISPASQGMAAMLYIYVCFYSMGWDGMFATVNIDAMGTFSLIIPDTKGRSLEEMDIIFGSVSAEKQSANVAKFEHVQDNGPEIGSTRSNDYSNTKA